VISGAKTIERYSQVICRPAKGDYLERPMGIFESRPIE